MLIILNRTSFKEFFYFLFVIDFEFSFVERSCVVEVAVTTGVFRPEVTFFEYF